MALAVSGHGFGHAVRCAEVARALMERGARVVVRSDAPRWLFPADVEWLSSPEWPLDVGVVQRDGLELDVDATRNRWQTFARDFEAHALAEAQLLNLAGVDLLVGDMPPLAFAAATRAGVPSLALGNFTWDWIYAVWPAFEDVVARIRAAYAGADSLLRLPLHATDPDAFAAFEKIEDVPLIARRASRRREEVRRQLGWPIDRRVVLLSFGGFDVRGLNLSGLGRWSEYTFVLIQAHGPLPANVLNLNQSPADYVSLLAACDVVVTKPGYGIVADCLANRVPVLFTDRGPFREYDVLADALTRLGRACYLPRQDLLAGNLGPHLAALGESSRRWTKLPMNGAAVVADRVLRRIAIDLG
ncbi:MAG: hypothetical protein JO352_23525 [Chloroflexi bacterium]|nr:hypothetical protein [Chloroflexota bacterium]